MYSDVKIRRRSIEDQKSAVIYLDKSSFISSTQCLRCSVIGEIVSAIAWVAQVTAEETQKWADGSRLEMIKYSKPKRGEERRQRSAYEVQRLADNVKSRADTSKRIADDAKKSADEAQRSADKANAHAQQFP